MSSFQSNKEYFSQGDLPDKDVFSLNFTLTNFGQTSIYGEKTTFHIYKAVLILCLVSHMFVVSFIFIDFYDQFWYFHSITMFNSTEMKSDQKPNSSSTGLPHL